MALFRPVGASFGLIQRKRAPFLELDKVGGKRHRKIRSPIIPSPSFAVPTTLINPRVHTIEYLCDERRVGRNPAHPVFVVPYRYGYVFCKHATFVVTLRTLFDTILNELTRRHHTGKSRDRIPVNDHKRGWPVLKRSALSFCGCSRTHERDNSVKSNAGRSASYSLNCFLYGVPIEKEEERLLDAIATGLRKLSENAIKELARSRLWRS